MTAPDEAMTACWASSPLRETAVMLLATQGEQAPLEPLLAAACDPLPTVREAALYALSDLGEQAPRTVWRGALADENEDVREAARLCLFDLQASGTPQDWLRQLGDPDPWIREAALRAFREHGPEEDAAALVELFVAALADLDADVRREAVWALVRLGSGTLGERLIEQLQTDDENLRGTIAVALGTLERQDVVDRLATVARDDVSRSVRMSALRALAKHPQQAPIGALLAAASGGQAHLTLDEVLFPLALGRYAPVDQLVEWLGHPDEAVRRNAVIALIQIGTPAALEASLVALQDAHERVRWAFLKERRSQKHPLPVSQIESLLDDPATPVRREALLALEEREDPTLREPIMSRLTDPNEFIRAVAVRALAALLASVEHEERITLLMQRYDDESPFVRASVIGELGGVGAPLPWEAIRLRLGDPSSYVRVEVLRVFEQHLPTGAVDIFLAALGDEAHDVREVAIEILTEHFPEALQTQVAQARAVFAGQSPDLPLATHLQTCWARTLREQEYITPGQAERLMTLLNWPHWQVRYQALQALTTHRRRAPEAARTRAGELISDPDSPVVRDAAQALLDRWTTSREDSGS